jgi:Uma2 family endonuclease
MKQSERRYSIEQYFLVEETSEIKHEYFDGEIFAMAGGSREHDTIVGNVFAHFHTMLRGSSCQPYSSDMRVRTPAGLYTYPDVSIVCGPPQIIRVRGTDTIENPIVLVEVLSESTCDYDRGQKFDLYGSIASLKDYVLIDQAQYAIEHRFRSDRGPWSTEMTTMLDQSVRLTGVDLELPLTLAYERISL